MDMEGYKPEICKTGTTTMAVVYDGGVMLGADSRTSAGNLIANRVSDKLEPIHKRIYCQRSGTSAHTQALAHYVRHYISGLALEMEDLPPVKGAATIFQKIMYPNKDMLSASIICAGWDPYDGPQIYQLPLGATLIKAKIAMGGSGSTFIHGFCDTHFREGMSQAECKEFVQNAISLAMYRDGASGGVIRMIDIRKEGVERHYISYNDLKLK